MPGSQSFRELGSTGASIQSNKVRRLAYGPGSGPDLPQPWLVASDSEKRSASKLRSEQLHVWKIYGGELA